MSYLTVKLDHLMQQREWKIADLARATGIDDAKLSRILSERQQWIAPTDLEKICLALGRTLEEKAAIIAARLMDLRAGGWPGSDLVQISVGGQPMLLHEGGQPPLTPRMEEDFATLRANIHDPDLQTIVSGLARTFRKSLLPTPVSLRPSSRPKIFQK